MPSRNHRGIDLGLAVAALPVEDSYAENVALELFVIEVLLGEKVLRFADPAERLEDDAVAVRRRSVDVLKQLALFDDMHALEREVDYLRVSRPCWLGSLRGEDCRREKKGAGEPIGLRAARRCLGSPRCA